jgi:hypothetical protein
MTPAEVIREARNVLFERGWTQGRREADDGAVCLEAALSIAICGKPRFLCEGARGTQGVIAAIEAAIDTDTESTWEWNDYYRRTFNEVIDALDRAEKLAEAAS